MNQPQSRARQVDSVLSADGRRPARRRRRVAQAPCRFANRASTPNYRPSSGMSGVATVWERTARRLADQV